MSIKFILGTEIVIQCKTNKIGWTTVRKIIPSTLVLKKNSREKLNQEKHVKDEFKKTKEFKISFLLLYSIW